MITSEDHPSTAGPQKTRALFLLIFLLSIALRLALTLVNREANDPHMEVIELILHNDTLPVKDDCWECFQPKLFHIVVVAILRMFNITGADMQIVAAQLLNLVIGALTLGVVWHFLARLPQADKNLSLLSFAYVAFNPKLIGISSQATNDAFIIFFSTLAFYTTYKFLHEGKAWQFVLIILCVVLAISSKTNGWITFTAILLALLGKAVIHSAERLRTEIFVLAYLIIVPLLAVINPLNQYISNYQGYGTPMLVNINRAEPPHLFEKTVAARPGILSIQDGFFTFKFIELLKFPRTNNDRLVYVPHRTSLWAQLYGRAHSVNFDNWPGSWGSTGEAGFNLRRAIYVLALAPTALLILGMLVEATTFLIALHKKDLKPCESLSYGLFPLAFLGYMAFIALYAYTYRDYAVMKAVFTYPALLAFPVCFMTAAQKTRDWLAPRARWISTAFIGLSITLFCLYAADVISLTMRLHIINGVF